MWIMLTHAEHDLFFVPRIPHKVIFAKFFQDKMGESRSIQIVIDNYCAAQKIL